MGWATCLGESVIQGLSRLYYCCCFGRGHRGAKLMSTESRLIAQREPSMTPKKSPESSGLNVQQDGVPKKDVDTAEIPPTACSATNCESPLNLSLHDHRDVKTLSMTYTTGTSTNVHNEGTSTTLSKNWTTPMRTSST